MDVSDVFKNKLPEDMTDDEIDAYVKSLREQREKFLKPKPKTTKASSAKSKKPLKGEVSDATS